MTKLNPLEMTVVLRRPGEDGEGSLNASNAFQPERVLMHVILTTDAEAVVVNELDDDGLRGQKWWRGGGKWERMRRERGKRWWERKPINKEWAGLGAHVTREFGPTGSGGHILSSL
jgi:hypothetical protein